MDTNAMQLRLGETLKITHAKNISTISKIIDVVPVRYSAIDEAYVVCEQASATFMVIRYIGDNDQLYCTFVEIGKCDNIYMLADAIVD